MEKYDRIQALHEVLSKSAEPVPKAVLEEKLQCSNETVQRLIAEAREYLDAPIDYDKKENGFYYQKSARSYELPGLWFNATEIYALLATHQLLSNVQPGFLSEHIAPLKQRIEAILDRESFDYKTLASRVRILQMAARRPQHQVFARVAGALLNRQRLSLQYHGREKDKQSRREVSPQRLVYYRDNWYLDAWCHLRQGLRSFSLDCIQKVQLLSETALDIDDKKLDSHYTQSYGIFAGEVKHNAVLRFSVKAARWVARETWHSKQNGQFELDGSYILEVPFGDSRELMMDIMKYGAEVEVLSPDSLRRQVAQAHAKAAGLYNDQVIS